MVRLSRGIYKGTFVAVVLATATMLAVVATRVACGMELLPFEELAWQVFGPLHPPCQ